MNSEVNKAASDLAALLKELESVRSSPFDKHTASRLDSWMHTWLLSHGAEVLKQLSAGEAVSIDEMVNRFLGWKLPEDFAPDYGIRFARNEMHDRHGMPTGTNLFHAGEAKEMFTYCTASRMERGDE